MMPVVPRVAPVRPAEHVEPPKKPQTENHNSENRRQEKRESAAQAAVTDAAERHLRITRDDAAKAFVYRSVEAETGDVVWQWPSEQILRRAQYRHEAEQQSHEVDEKA